MSDHATNIDRVIDLAGAVCDETASQNDLVELDSIVVADEASRRCYWDYCWIHVALGVEARVHRALRNATEKDGLDSSLLTPWESDVLMGTMPPDETRPSAPVLGFLGNASQGTVGYFSSGWPVAYLVATVIFGIGLLVGSLVYVSHPVQIAVQLPSTEKISSVPEAKTELVGRITGMIDCIWADPKIAPVNNAVPLGHKYELSSGLMEITYDTGAKVILQGPVAYVVESPASGFLSVGKLTAKLKKKAEESNPQSPIPNPLLSTLHSPLFTIKTPTATVTDLGTEFGVEVSENGDTRAQVFVGSVRITAAESGSETGQVVQAGQAAAVGAKSAQVVIVQINPEDKSPFVRVVTPPKHSTQSEDSYADLVLSMNPVVYYRMERPTGEKNHNVLIDSAPGAHHGVVYMGDEFGQPYLSGRFGQSLGLRGKDIGDCAIVPNCPETNTNRLSFSAWVMADSRPHMARIAGLGELFSPTSQNIRVFLFPASMDLAVKVRQPDGSDVMVHEGEAHPLPPSSWQHVAFMVDGSTLRLYRNGEEVASSPCSGILYDRPETYLTLGGQRNEEDPKSQPSYCWRGRLDEVALFHYALTSDQVRQLYLAKKLVSTTTKSLPIPSETPERQRFSE